MASKKQETVEYLKKHRIAEVLNEIVHGLIHEPENPYAFLADELEKHAHSVAGDKRIVVLIGPPGSGKGTQAVKIKERFNVAHLSTGDMLRAAVQADTAVGREAALAMKEGKLVRDEVIIGAIREAISKPECAQGFMLDGFPRNTAQAVALDRMLAEKGERVTDLVNLEVPDADLVERICGRWTHTASGRSYHTKFNPPKVSGIDDVTGEPLEQRKDDNEEALKTRLVTFHQQTAPVIAYYSRKDITHNIDASVAPAQVTLNVFVALDGPKRILVLLGPPGSGKGTQAVKLKDRYNLAHLSTGDMLRAAVKAGTDVGKAAAEAMNAGKLVSDNIIIGAIREAITRPECEAGFILDGFPRNTDQARALDEMLASAGNQVTSVLSLEVPDADLVERICGRWTHKASGRSYHTKFNPPKEPGKDDITGEALEQRADDNEEALRTRLVAFHEQTAPIKEHYKERVCPVDASVAPSEVTELVFKVLDTNFLRR